MECSNPEIEQMLSDYFTGHLGDVQDGQVEEHLEVCQSCRRMIRTMALIAGKSATEISSISSGHFSPQLLSRFFSQPGTLESSLSIKIVEHLKDCPECSADMDFLKNSDIDLRNLVLSYRKSPSKKTLISRLLDFFNVKD